MKFPRHVLNVRIHTNRAGKKICRFARIHGMPPSNYQNIFWTAKLILHSYPILPLQFSCYYIKNISRGQILLLILQDFTCIIVALEKLGGQ